MVSDLLYKPGLGKSDHLILDFTYNCCIRSCNSSSKKLNYFKGNYGIINDKLQGTNWEQDLQGLGLPESWEIPTEKLMK